MNTIKTIGLTAVAVLALSACGGGGSGSDTITATLTNGKIVFNDGTALGVTRAENQENGGFNVYDIATGEIVGFIALDGSVNGADGTSYGICQGLTISDNGLEGECNLEISNPNGSTSTSSTSTSSTSTSSTSTGSSSDNSGSETIVDDTPIVDQITSTGTLNGSLGGTLTEN